MKPSEQKGEPKKEERKEEPQSHGVTKLPDPTADVHRPTTEPGGQRRDWGGEDQPGQDWGREEDIPAPEPGDRRDVERQTGIEPQPGIDARSSGRIPPREK